MDGFQGVLWDADLTAHTDAAELSVAYHAVGGVSSYSEYSGDLRDSQEQRERVKSCFYLFAQNITFLFF